MNLGYDDSSDFAPHGTNNTSILSDEPLISQVLIDAFDVNNKRHRQYLALYKRHINGENIRSQLRSMINKDFQPNNFWMRIPSFFTITQASLERTKNGRTQVLNMDTNRFIFKNSRNKKKLTQLKSEYALRSFKQSLPYENVLDNDCGDEECVPTWFIKAYGKGNRHPISIKAIKKYFGNHVNHTIDVIDAFCKKYKIYHQVMTILGHTIHQSEEGDYTEKHRKKLIYVIHDNHIYPVAKDFRGRLELRQNDENVYDPESTFIDRNGTIYHSKGKTWDPSRGKKASVDSYFYDKELFDDLPQNFSFKCEERLGPVALHTSNMTIYNSDEAKCIDMKKCYFNVARNIISKKTKIGVFTVQDIYVKYNKEKIRDDSYYLIDDKCGAVDYGYLCNCLMGKEVKTLIKNKVMKKKNILKVKSPSSWFDWKHMHNKIDDVVHEQNGGDKKAFNQFNGILGIKNHRSDETVVNIPAGDLDYIYFREYPDRQFKFKTHEFDADGNQIIDERGDMVRTVKHYAYLNTRNIYDYVVSSANSFILDCHFDVMKKNDVKLLKIKTDSLTYDGPVDISSFKWAKYFKDETVKFEDETPKKYNMFFNELKYDFKMDNITYIGRPGTGKTFTVKRDHEFDACTSVSNVCCRNIGAEKTLYTLLNMRDHKEFIKVLQYYKDKTVWVDEFSMVPLRYWANIFVMAVNGCKFIFSGDMNQIGPVQGKKIDMKSHVFSKVFGQVTTLTTNHRNDAKIIEMSEKALKGGTLKKKNKHKIEDCKVHLCFTHSFKNKINCQIAKKKKIKWGDIGSRIVFMSKVKKYNVDKNEVYDITSNDGKEVVITSVFYEDPKILTVPIKALEYADLGYAMTIHASQGLTVKEPYYVHEIDRSSPDLIYTGITRGRKFDDLNLGFKSCKKGLKAYHECKVTQHEDKYLEVSF